MDAASRSSETTNNCASATYKLCVSNTTTVLLQRANSVAEDFLNLSFRRVLYVVCFLLGISPAPEF